MQFICNNKTFKHLNSDFSSFENQMLNCKNINDFLSQWSKKLFMTEKDIYKKTIKSLTDKTQEIKTLGGRSKFSILLKNNIITITNSSGNEKNIDEELFQQVAKRYLELSDNLKNTTSSYTDPTWIKCPSRIFSPYVAALIKFVIENIN